VREFPRALCCWPRHRASQRCVCRAESVAFAVEGDAVVQPCGLALRSLLPLPRCETGALQRSVPETGALHRFVSETGALHRSVSETGALQGSVPETGALHRSVPETGALQMFRPGPQLAAPDRKAGCRVQVQRQQLAAPDRKARWRVQVQRHQRG